MKDIIHGFLLMIFLFTITNAGHTHIGEKHQKMSEPPPAKERMQEAEPVTPSLHETEMVHRPTPHVEWSPYTDIIFLLLVVAGGTFLVIRGRRFWAGENR